MTAEKWGTDHICRAWELWKIGALDIRYQLYVNTPYNPGEYFNGAGNFGRWQLLFPSYEK